MMKTPANPRRAVLIVGNLLSAHMGTRSLSEELASRLAERGWSVVATSTRLNRVARLADMVSTVWRRRRSYAVGQVCVYSGLAFFWAEVVCAVLKALGKPYILSLEGGNLPAFARRHPGRVRRLLRSAAVVTTTSDYLREHLQACRDDIQHLPAPLNVSAYPFRRREDLQPRLVWLRAFHQIYNPTMAAAVVALLRDDFPDIHLTMIGPDKGDGSREAFLAAAETCGIADHISLLGSIPKADVPIWLSQGDVFLNTTTADNMPVSVLEAMACGLCVISTEVGGIPYMLDHDYNALLVPSGDAEAMAAAVRRVLTDPALARRLSSNARTTTEAYDWSVILPQWEAHLLSVIESHPA